MLAASFFEQRKRVVFVKARIARLEDEEKSIVSHALESLPVEHWMVPAREEIHRQHGEERAEGGEQNRQFKHDRKKRRHGPKVGRLAVDIERIKKPRWPELHYRRGQQTS